jgi:hypothetical protein
MACRCAEGQTHRRRGTRDFEPRRTPTHLGVHDCAYIMARDSLITRAEEETIDKLGSHSAKDWSKEFSHTMERLWRESHLKNDIPKISEPLGEF